jgi:hypothetical protein
MRTLPSLLPLLLLVVACRDEPRRSSSTARRPFAIEAVAFGPRVPGTEAHQRAAVWLDSLLRERADTVVTQRWRHVDAGRHPADGQLHRPVPAGKPQRLLFLAHWDSRPRADAPTSRDSTLPVPGANDGGSGVALLLGVADVLKRSPPTIGVDLLFVDGEDFGDFTATPTDVLIGSRHYAANPVPGPAPLYAVLFDLVADRELQIYQEGNSLVGAPEVVNLVWEAARKVGHGGSFIESPRHTLIDDHLELQKVGIRAIDVVDFDYAAWHTPDDTMDKVSVTSLQIVGDVAMALVRGEQ